MFGSLIKEGQWSHKNVNCAGTPLSGGCHLIIPYHGKSALVPPSPILLSSNSLVDR